MRLLLSPLLLSACLLAQIFHPSSGPSKIKFVSHVPKSHRQFFVLFNDDSKTLEQNQEFFNAQLRQLNIRIKPRLSFKEFFEGISFELAYSYDLPQIATISNVKEIYPVLNHARPRVIKKDIRDMALKYTHGVTGVAGVRAKLGYKGKGIKVGVIDSGIDYTHPDLGGCFGPNCRVAYGYNFVAEELGESPNDPKDNCIGHGTHVAGIIGANGKNLTGVAPEVTFGAYKVFNCKDLVSDDLVVAALERAYKDGMDIINLSLGYPGGWAGHPTSLAVDKIVERGVHVFAASGNAGYQGMWQTGSPAMASKAFSVASFDNFRYMAEVFVVSSTNATTNVTTNSSNKSNDKMYDYIHSASVTVNFTNVELVSADNGQDDLACAPFSNATMFADKIVLAQRGNCSWEKKVSFLRAAGAIAAMFYNDEHGPLYVVAKNKDFTTVSVTQTTGAELYDLISKGPVFVSFLSGQYPFDNPYGGKISAFSSWGPGPLLEQKPDIGAPGGLIYSTYPIANGSYVTLSGTSMSTPYAAAAAAIYLQARGKKSPGEILDILRQTAVPATVFGTNNLSPVQQQGAGMINIQNALACNTIVSPSKIHLLSDDLEQNRTRVFTVTNTGKQTFDYLVSHNPALSVQPWDIKTGELSQRPMTTEIQANVTIVPKTFRLLPGKSIVVTVTFARNAQVSNSEMRILYGGYLKITPKKLGKVDRTFIPVTSHVTYSGMFGNYKKTPLFPSKSYPIVIDVRDFTMVKNETKPFTLEESDFPIVFYRLIHPARRVRIWVMSEEGEVLGALPGADTTRVSRNDEDANTLYFRKWMGMASTNNGTVYNVTDGNYRLRVEALPPFGDENVVSDWQQWNSPLIRVNRSTSDSASSTTTVSEEQLIETSISRVLSMNRRRNGVESTSKGDESVLIRPFNVAPSTI